MKLPYYFICSPCAAERGGVDWKTGNTRCLDKCPYCNSKEDVTVTPVVDFRWPRDQPKEPRHAKKIR